MTYENITAFLIHSRDYQNSSQLVDFLTDEFGLIRLIAKGSKNSKQKLQPFLQLNINFSGKSALKSLKSWEVVDSPRYLQGNQVVLMMYINEIISKLAPSDALHICADYLYALTHLSDDVQNNEWQLRLFENAFLEQIGYGIDFTMDSVGCNIEPHKNYDFVLNQGFIVSKVGISGAEILRIGQQIMPQNNGLYFCKKINRQRINFLLKGRELQTRKLFSVK
jgi:DNA repair protein RecO (recombination protein O)